MEEDIDLVKKAQGGDNSSFEKLFGRYSNMIYYHAYKTIMNKSLAEDIVQETFLQAFKNIKSIKKPESFKWWIVKVCENNCRHYYRENKEEPILDSNDTNIEADNIEENNTDFMPDEAVDKQEFKTAIMDVINGLPDKRRSVIIMRYYEEIPVKQISEILDMPEGTVKSNLNYARKNIRTGIENYEKKYGIRLHDLAIAPMLVWLFHSMAKEMVLPKESAKKIASTIHEQLPQMVNNTDIASSTKYDNAAKEVKPQSANTDTPDKNTIDNAKIETKNNVRSGIPINNKPMGIINKFAKYFTGKKLILLCICVIAVIGGITAFVIQHRYNFDAGSYITYSIKGANGLAQLNLDTDSDKFLNSLPNAYSASNKKPVDLLDFLDTIKYTADKTTNIKNGDVIHIKVSFNNEKAKAAGIRAKNNYIAKKIEVSGLKQPIKINAFDGFEVTFSGQSGYGSYDYKTTKQDKKYNLNSFNGNSLIFKSNYDTDYNNVKNLKDKEKITFTAQLSDQMKDEHKYILLNPKKTYVVSGLSEYIFDPSFFTKDKQKSIDKTTYNYAEEHLDAGLYNYLSLDSKVLSITKYKSYFGVDEENEKYVYDPKVQKTYNHYYAVYKVKAEYRGNNTVEFFQSCFLSNVMDDGKGGFLLTSDGDDVSSDFSNGNTYLSYDGVPDSYDTVYKDITDSGEKITEIK